MSNPQDPGYGGPPPGGGWGPPPAPPGGGWGPPPAPPGGGWGPPPAPPGGGWGPPPQGPPGGGWGPPPGPDGYGPSPGGRQTDQAAIVSLVCGICSFPALFCCSLFGVPLSIGAIIAGVVALGNINKKPELDGKPMAIAGIAIGGVSIVLLVLLLAFGVAGMLLDKKL